MMTFSLTINIPDGDNKHEVAAHFEEAAKDVAERLIKDGLPDVDIQWQGHQGFCEVTFFRVE